MAALWNDDHRIDEHNHVVVEGSCPFGGLWLNRDSVTGHKHQSYKRAERPKY